ncbi:MAG: hypothetical protein ABIS50_20110 [Luteolibacter sp.]|uniref:hypothetical protein n=1 Tax=Luteolibacter sp. TaxID=1962973 RepID=UPI003267409B
METPDEEKKGRAGTTLSIVVISLLLYVLSVGPAVIVVSRNSYLLPYYMKIYAPINWLCKLAPSLNDPLSNYMDWWVGSSP